MAGWDYTEASRGEHQVRAAELKKSGTHGEFFIRGRPKSGPPNSLGLTIRTDAYDRGALANFLIERSPNGYQVRGGDALFRSLPDLVMYYSMSAKAPLNIKLAGDTFHDDGLGLGLDELDDGDENYGFIEEDDDDDILTGLHRPPTLTAAGTAQQNYRSQAPPAKIPAPMVDMSSLSKIEMLRKQAEVLAAKRRAAEMNVQMLSEHAAPAMTNPRAREEAEAVAKQRMEAEMLEMRNVGALAAWQNQLEEIDRLRARTRATAQRQTADGAELPPRTNVDGSVHRLYEEVGLYSNSFAAKVKQVEAAEAVLKADEERVAVLAAISELVRSTLDTVIDRAVSQTELARNDHKTQGIEEKYRMTQEIANQRDAKLQQVSQVFAHASSVLGGGAMLGPPQPQQHPWGGNDGSMNAFATYAAPEPPQQHHMPPSQYGANPYANQHVYATVPMPPPQQTYAHQQQTYAVPESQLRPPPPPVAQMSTAGAPLQGLTERANAWQAKAPLTETDDDDDEPAPVTHTWRSPGASNRAPARNAPPPPAAASVGRTFEAFSVVKRKPPPGHNAEQSNLDQVCTFLGNCTCPKCR